MNPGSHAKHWSLVYVRDVLQVLVSRDFKLRYKRSVLGIAWSLLVPLAQLAVMYVVFNDILKLNIPHYTSFLLAGILPWIWFQSSLVTSSMTIVENRELVKQVGFPVAVLPTVTVLSQMIHFLLALPILGVFLLLDGLRPGPSLLALPLVILVQFALTVSLAYIVATLQVKFRDTQYLVGISLLLFSYLTPVFWDFSGIPEPYYSIFMFNPVARLLTAYRAILLHGQWPEPGTLAVLAVIAGIVLSAGSVLFLRARDRFVEEL
jgi:lipopolysaccharide transport system permease protein